MSTFFLDNFPIFRASTKNPKIFWIFLDTRDDDQFLPFDDQKISIFWFWEYFWPLPLLEKGEFFCFRTIPCSGPSGAIWDVCLDWKSRARCFSAYGETHGSMSTFFLDNFPIFRAFTKIQRFFEFFLGTRDDDQFLPFDDQKIIIFCFWKAFGRYHFWKRGEFFCYRTIPCSGPSGAIWDVCLDWKSKAKLFSRIFRFDFLVSTRSRALAPRVPSETCAGLQIWGTFFHKSIFGVLSTFWI